MCKHDKTILSLRSRFSQNAKTEGIKGWETLIKEKVITLGINMPPSCSRAVPELLLLLLFYLWTYKAPLTVQPNQRRFQCERPLEKRKVLRERAEKEVPPRITSEHELKLEGHSTAKVQQRHSHDAVLWQSETEELEGHDGQKSGEDVQRQLSLIRSQR